jgi:hypothetical protein
MLGSTLTEFSLLNGVESQPRANLNPQSSQSCKTFCQGFGSRDEKRGALGAGLRSLSGDSDSMQLIILNFLTLAILKDRSLRHATTRRQDSL